MCVFDGSATCFKTTTPTSSSLISRDSASVAAPITSVPGEREEGGGDKEGGGGGEDEGKGEGGRGKGGGGRGWIQHENGVALGDSAGAGALKKNAPRSRTQD